MATAKKKLSELELGTNVMDRQVLRMLCEISRVSGSLRELGLSAGLTDALNEATVGVEIRRLLIVAAEFANRYNNADLDALLAKTKAADDEALASIQKKQMDALAKESPLASFIDAVRSQMTKSCPECKQHLCGDCGKCHDCEQRKQAPLN